MADVTYTQKIDKSKQSDVLKRVAEDLIEVERQIPAGGSAQFNFEKNKTENVGIYANLTIPTRKHTACFRPKTVQIESKGSTIKNETVQYVEEVENSRFPCGTYNLCVSNRYNVDVGAGGLSIKSVGSFRIQGNARGVISATDEIYISSKGNINLASSDDISIVSKSLRLQGSNQVLIDSNLGVKSNLLVNGGAFIDGEVFLNHISCPAEVQYTGGGIGSFGQLMFRGGESGTSIGGAGTAVIAYADVSYIKTLYNSIAAKKAPWTLGDKIPVLVLPDSGATLASNAGNNGNFKNPEYSIFVYPHEHPFNNIPLSFVTGNEKMRSAASKMNTGGPINASPISHGYKTPK